MLGVALGVGMRASLRMVLMCPQLMSMQVQQALDMAQLVAVLQLQPMGPLLLDSAEEKVDTQEAQLPFPSDGASLSLQPTKPPTQPEQDTPLSIPLSSSAAAVPQQGLVDVPSLLHAQPSLLVLSPQTLASQVRFFVLAWITQVLSGPVHFLHVSASALKAVFAFCEWLS